MAMTKMAEMMVVVAVVVDCVCVCVCVCERGCVRREG